MMLDRLPPHDTEAEEAVVAACLVDPGMVPVVGQIVRPKMFFHERAGLVFEAIERVYSRDGEQGVNTVTVARDLASRDLLDGAGGSQYLAGIVQGLTASSGAAFYAEIVRDTASRRALITVASGAMDAAYREGDEITVAVDKLIEALGRVGRSTSLSNRTMSADELLYEGGLNDAIMAHLENPRAMMGFSTGYWKLDHFLDGFQRGNVYILAAETSIGKSLFTHNLLRHIAPHRPCLIASSEMSRKSVGKRLAYIQAGIDPQIVKRRGWYEPQERAALMDALRWFEELGKNLHFHQGRMTPSALRLEARAIKARHGLDLLVLDHMDHVKPQRRSGGNRTEDVEELNAELNALAADLDIAVLAVSHLSRDNSQGLRKDRMSRLKNSSSKEQDAHAVIFLAPVAFDPDTGWWIPLSHEDALQQRSRDGFQTVEVNVAKNRDGLTGAFHLTMSWNLGGRYFDPDAGQEAML